jgi:hypothetical protein
MNLISRGLGLFVGLGLWGAYGKSRRHERQDQPRIV